MKASPRFVARSIFLAALLGALGPACGKSVVGFPICGTSADCSSGTVCRDDLCKVVRCGNDAACALDEVCLAGTCSAKAIAISDAGVDATAAVDATLPALDAAADTGSDACAPTCTVGSACGATSDCASGLLCAAGVCSYATSCAALQALKLPAGTYTLDPDGAGPNPPEAVYCPLSPTSTLQFAPVGLCQAESGATPACHSFVGAAGFPTTGINYGGTMAVDTSGAVMVGPNALFGDRGIVRLGDGSLVVNDCCTPSAASGGVRRYELDGGSVGYPTTEEPHGLVALFDGRLLTDNGSYARTFDRSLVSQGTLSLLTTLWPEQSPSGELWAATSDTTTGAGMVSRFTPDGTYIAAFTSDALKACPRNYALISLADGRTVVACEGGSLIFFDVDNAPITFSSTPDGGTLLNDGGALTQANLSGIHELLELPNRQILVASCSSQALVRFNTDGSFAGALALSFNPSGMTLTSDGSLYVTQGSGCNGIASGAVVRVTFQ